MKLFESDTDDQTRRLFTELMKLAVPVMAFNLLQTFYTLADSFFLGKLGKEALSAPAISGSIVYLLSVFGMGFSAAGTTLVARARGMGDREQEEFYVGQSTTILLALSAIFVVIALALLDPLLRLMNVPADSYLNTKHYLGIITAGLPFSYLSFSFQSCMQGHGDSFTPLKVQLLSVIINIALDPLLIFGIGFFPRLEVIGAAVTTFFSFFISSLVGYSILIRGRRAPKLRLKNLVVTRRSLKLFITIGTPLSVGQAMTALGFTVLQRTVNYFGSTFVAAFGVGNRITSLFHMPAFGFARATAAMVGQSLGARDRERAVAVARLSILSIFVFMVAGMTFTSLMSAPLVRVFVNEPEVVELGARFLRIVSPTLIFLNMQGIIHGAFQGGGYTKATMMLSVLRLWGLRVPLAHILGVLLFDDPVGVYISVAISNVLPCLFAFGILRKRKWLYALDSEYST